MNKSQRLIALMIKMNTKRQYTLRELANEFKVSKRTIMRDMQELSELGIPIYSELGINGGYKVLNERVIPPVMFTENEALSIFFMAQSLRFYRSLPYEAEWLSIMNKLTNILPTDTKNKIEEVKKRVLFWVPPQPNQFGFLTDLLNASLEQYVLSVEYESETKVSKKEIQPIGIYTMNGIWYCVALVYPLDQFRTFRVDRFREIEKSDNEITVNLDKTTILDWLEGSLQQKEEEEPLTLSIRLTRKGVLKCMSDWWLSEGLEVYDDETGHITRKMNASYIPWIISFVMSCGEDAILLEPQEAVEMIKEKLEKNLAHYI
jgi:predicted DNA-binding transcriptional regulator YafY